MIVKIHKTEDKRLVLAVCDKAILGKKFEELNKQIDLTSDFYKGEEKSDKQTSYLMRNSYMLNLVGEKTIKLALDDGIISKDNVKRICKIPYANVIFG
jgi:hypothetical protein